MLEVDLLMLKVDLLMLEVDLLMLEVDLLRLKVDLLMLKVDLLMLKVDLLRLEVDLLMLKVDLLRLEIENPHPGRVGLYERSLPSQAEYNCELIVRAGGLCSCSHRLQPVGYFDSVNRLFPALVN
jgi:hypothetical protein